jgi:adenosylcobinamide-phosphate synthase
VDGLTVEEVAGATIASVAENLSDSVIAPWLWHAVCGVPAAWAYRASNTLDAMWGYRDEPYEDLGAAAALLDDALNLVPARVTALAICMAAVGRGAGAEAWRRWRREAGRTVSPNAGHPMAAMAGALDVRLIKRGAYVLGEELREPGVEDIADAVRLARRAAMGVAAVLALGLAVVSPPLGN